MNIKQLNKLISLVDKNQMELLRVFGSVPELFFTEMKEEYNELQSIKKDLQNQIEKIFFNSIEIDPKTFGENKLKSVKFVKDSIGVSLMEAKRIVENYIDNNQT